MTAPRLSCAAVTRAEAVWFVAPRKVEIRPLQIEPPQPGQVLVRAIASGISAGTEMLAYRGELDDDVVADEKIGALSGGFRYPFRYGYSAVGEVESGGSRFGTGALVFAFHPHQDRFVADPGDVVDLSGAGIDARSATLFPLVETALQVSLDTGEVRHRAVVVAGLGALGLLVSLLLRRRGAEVIGSEPLEWRRAAAAALGIDAIDPAELPEVVERVTSGSGVPLAVDVSGAPAALAGVLDVVGHEGTVLVASWFGNKPVPLPLGGRFHRRRLTIRSTQVSTIPSDLADEWSIDRRRRETVALLAELPLANIATHEFRFADASTAYAAVDEPRPGLVHAALVYE